MNTTNIIARSSSIFYFSFRVHFVKSQQLLYYSKKNIIFFPHFDSLNLIGKNLLGVYFFNTYFLNKETN